MKSCCLRLSGATQVPQRPCSLLQSRARPFKLRRRASASQLPAVLALSLSRCVACRPSALARPRREEARRRIAGALPVRVAAPAATRPLGGLRRAPLEAPLAHASLESPDSAKSVAQARRGTTSRCCLPPRQPPPLRRRAKGVDETALAVPLGGLDFPLWHRGARRAAGGARAFPHL